MFIVISLFYISIAVYTFQWTKAEKFYAGILPGIAGFVFLYFWVVLYSYYKIIIGDVIKVGINQRNQPDPECL